MKRLHQSLLLGSLLMAAGVVALAQGNPAPAGAPSVGNLAKTKQFSPEGNERFREKIAERHAKRMDQLKARLKLLPGQEVAWNNFLTTMQWPMTDMHRSDRDALDKLSTPERVDRMNSLMATRQERWRQRGEASKALYAVLNDEQKKVFDHETAPSHRHRDHSRS